MMPTGHRAVPRAELIPLTAVAMELKALGFNPPAYRYTFNAALDARIPAERINARWYVRREDLPLIATVVHRKWGTPVRLLEQ
jgi:hypothetical protein